MTLGVGRGRELRRAPELAGETVVLWWGLFDHDLYVEHGERRFGPYTPSGGPIPSHRYRKYQKKASWRSRADRVAALAETAGSSARDLLFLWHAFRRHPPHEAGAGQAAIQRPGPVSAAGISPAHSLRSTRSPTKLGMPLAPALSAEDRAFIDALLRDTLEKPVVLTRVREHFRPAGGGSSVMLTEVMEHFVLKVELHTDGFYETEHHRQIIKDILAPRSVEAG